MQHVLFAKRSQQKRTFRGESPGVVVLADNSCSRDCEFESQRCILIRHFSHLFVAKIVFFVGKT